MDENLDLYFMREALKEANKAYMSDEVPIGAVLVHNQKIIAKGHNQVELLKDPTAHAEMICLTAGANYFNDWRLLDTTLYCTLEPCCMCSGAILAARIKKLIWAAPDIRIGANGSWIDVFEKDHPFHKIEIEKRVLEDEAKALLRRFFQKKRKKKALIEDFLF